MKKSCIAGLFREVQQAEGWSSVQARMSIPYQSVCPTADLCLCGGYGLVEIVTMGGVFTPKRPEATSVAP